MREKLVSKSFKIWDLSACSLAFQVLISLSLVLGSLILSLLMKFEALCTKTLDLVNCVACDGFNIANDYN